MPKNEQSKKQVKEHVKEHTGLFWLWISLLIFALDRLSEYWVLGHFEYRDPYVVFPFFNITLSFNTGAAFSFLEGASGWQNLFLSSIAVIVSLILIRWLMNISYKERWLSISLCFILGGALANLSDRILYGYVIDFLSVHWGTWYFAIFNIADAAISIGAVMLLLQWLFYREKE